MVKVHPILELIKKNQLYCIPIKNIDVVLGQCSCRLGENCGSAGKHPLPNFLWKYKASNQLENVDKWFDLALKGEQNIAVATGRWNKEKQKHLIVIDVDLPNHAILKKLPKTFSYRTGKLGHHKWYWSEHPLPNSVCHLDDKVDIRGTNGYVVIPPSNHISGREYVVENPYYEIANLPEWAYKILTSTKPTKTINKKSKLVCAPNLWSHFSIKEIKEKLQGGEKIKEGIRNSTIFRLLSSDRARGVQTSEELFSIGKQYCQHLENENTFSDYELDLIVGSVMKYKSYNTKASAVNKIYVSWMKMNGKLPKGDQKTENLLDELDDCFFKTKIKTSEKVRVPLEFVSKQREEFFKGKGLKSFSKYKPSLLAQKLKELGFTRTRTAKGNYWNVEMTFLDYSETIPSDLKESVQIINETIENKVQDKKQTMMNITIDELLIPQILLAAKMELDNYPAFEAFLLSLKPKDIISIGFEKYEVIDPIQKIFRKMFYDSVPQTLTDIAKAEISAKGNLCELLYREETEEDDIND